MFDAPPLPVSATPLQGHQNLQVLAQQKLATKLFWMFMGGHRVRPCQTASDRVRPRQTVSDRVRPCHSEFSCSAPAQLLSGRTDPRGAKAGALAGAVRLCKSCSAEIAEVLTATRLMMLNPSIIISQARWTHDIYIYILRTHTHTYT